MDTIPPELAKQLPSAWHTWLHTAFIVFLIVRPSIAALRNGSGLVGLWKSLLYGTHEITSATQPTKNEK